MIYDKLNHLHLYLGCHPNLDTAIRYLLSHDLNTLPLGQTVIDGTKIYFNVMEATAGAADQKNYEIHKNYMDIQIDIEGTELIQIGDSSCMEVNHYQADIDFGTAACPMLASCVIGPGNFIICMAQEPHKPGIAVSCFTALKKCVVKVHN